MTLWLYYGFAAIFRWTYINLASNQVSILRSRHGRRDYSKYSKISYSFEWCTCSKVWKARKLEIIQDVKKTSKRTWRRTLCYAKTLYWNVTFRRQKQWLFWVKRFPIFSSFSLIFPYFEKNMRKSRKMF